MALHSYGVFDIKGGRLEILLAVSYSPASGSGSNTTATATVQFYTRILTPLKSRLDFTLTHYYGGVSRKAVTGFINPGGTAGPPQYFGTSASYTVNTSAGGVNTKLSTVDRFTFTGTANRDSGALLPKRLLNAPPAVTSPVTTTKSFWNSGVIISWTQPTYTVDNAPASVKIDAINPVTNGVVATRSVTPNASGAAQSYSWANALVVAGVDRAYKFQVTEVNNSGSSSPKVGTSLYASPLSAPVLTRIERRINDVNTFTFIYTHPLIGTPTATALGLLFKGQQLSGDWLVTPETSSTGELTVTNDPYEDWSVIAFPNNAANLKNTDPSNSYPLSTSLSTPNKPTKVTPSGNVMVNSSTTTIPISWQHNPTDNSIQTKAELEIYDGITTSTIELTQSGTSYALPKVNWGSSPNGNVTIKVYTAGVTGTYSLVSDTSTFYLLYPPTVNMTAPANGATVITARIPVSWTYAQYYGVPQGKFKVEIFDASSQLISSKTVTGTATSYTTDTPLQDGTTYTIRVTVWNNRTDAIYDWAERTVTTNFVNPEPLTVTGDWDDELGLFLLTMVDSNTNSSIPDVLNALVERSLDGGLTWKTVNDGVELVSKAATIPDNQTPSRGEVKYRVTGYSFDLLASVTNLTLFASSTRVWLNAGVDFSDFISIPYNIEIKETKSRVNSSIYNFDGRAKPVSIVGPEMTHTIEVSGKLDPDEYKGSTWEQVMAFMDRDDSVFLYRDQDGRRLYVSPPDISMDRGKRNLRSISFGVTEVDYDG